VDLKTIITWAKTVNLANIETKNKERVNNYIEMIVERGRLIDQYTTKTDSFIKDIMEYIVELKKVGMDIPGADEVKPPPVILKDNLTSTVTTTNDAKPKY